MIRKSILFLFLIFGLHIFSQKLFNHAEQITGFGDTKENNGVAVADYDGDFDLDVFVVTVWKDEVGKTYTQSKLYRNNGNGTYTDVTAGSGLENLLPFGEVNATYERFLGLKGFKNGAFWGDYDNDGDPDILFTHLSQVQLFQNQGNGTFNEVTHTSGIKGTNDCENMGAVWFDYNNDSFLDLFIADWSGCSSHTLYKNLGNGNFSDVTKLTNLENAPKFKGYNPFPFDFNNDGWMDLYLTNDFTEPNQLFINTQGLSFQDKASNYNIDSKFNDMGIAIGDYNKDGNYDFYITTIANNVLLEGKSDFTFQNKAIEYNVKETGWSWGTKFADFDLDGDEDLIVVNGFKSSSQREIPNLYIENKYSNNTVTFSINKNLGIGEEPTISVEVLDFDYDLDGDLDLFITNSEANSFFYENQTIHNSDNQLVRWFQLSLQGTVSNRDAIGAKIILTTDTDTFIRYYNGVGFLSQSLKPIHFGLGNATKIESLKIIWPSGNVDTYSDLELNTFGKAIEKSGYEKLNIQPSIKILGCTNPNSCNYNPNATISDGSCIFVDEGKAISGPSEVSFLSEATYFYELSENATIKWNVEGGILKSGQGTSEIKVHWEFSNKGKVSAIVTTSQCKSEEKVLNVNLRLNGTTEIKSIARIWNEALLEAIRGDFARPTVHARNLFHVSVGMYDAWAIYSNEASTYLVGNTINNFSSSLQKFSPQEDIKTSREKAISYAAYRILSHRFKNSPSATSILEKLNFLMSELGFDINYTDIDYESGNAAALGNFIAKTVIDYGYLDGAREETGYDNEYYEPVNPPLAPTLPGNSTLTNVNRWQSLSLDTFIDQSGNLIEGEVIDFLSPEWGNVWTFAMDETNKKTYSRDGNSYTVYFDPLAPPYLDSSEQSSSNAYKKGFSQVAIWGSHLDASDGVLWDISPKSIGNIDISQMPSSYNDFHNFYNYFDGGDIGKGHAINPITNSPYESQIVPRGDYTRVLAEFWADGPDSETPPGHWFTILNYVSDHEQFQKKFSGQGDVLDDLEWDVKSYFILGGAMHDAAVASWSIKGWYDYLRPISAIRYMAGLGQSSDSSLPSYHPNGILLEEGYIELVTENDPLAFRNPENIGKIKLKTWVGHKAINNTDTDVAGVDWILAEEWWPYQRPSFVTPPFAGYVSGHSTYSRAAAEIMTLLTGNAFFPGGMGEFVANKNEFLVFEEGPSVDVKLQWATYRDASDQCSLSRIWGGIHPPADDIPGRLIGEKIGKQSFNFAVPYFSRKLTLSTTDNLEISNKIVYPNPIQKNSTIFIKNTDENEFYSLSDLKGRKFTLVQQFDTNLRTTKISLQNVASGIYILLNDKGEQWKIIITK